jgi:peptidoglycan/xylan/chitin deacetylase (PgdA/CDA1 family)
MKHASILSLLLVLPLFTAPAAETRREMAVTFDDLPFVTHITGDAGAAGLKPRTARLLETLKRHNVPAIGFVNAGKLFNGDQQNRERTALLRMWLDGGFELGNHTYSHKDFHRVSWREFREDLVKGELVIDEMMRKRGMALRYFRHPLLHTGNSPEKRKQLDELLKKRAYTVAPVSIDNSEWIYARAYHNVLKNGDKKKLNTIVDSYIDYMERKINYYEAQSRALLGREIKQVLLLHANELNADHFGRLAGMIKKRGYTFISLDRVLGDPAYKSADTYTGRGGISWLHRWAISQGKKGAFFKGEPEAPEFIKKLAKTKYE